MKPGTRALGIAESYCGETSTLAGCVVRANRVVDGFVFGRCTVGGTDATDTIIGLFDRLGREDIHYLMVAGIAPAWFNVVDLHRVHDVTNCPTISVTFEESEGLETTLHREFDGEAAASRLSQYRSQPDRRAVDVGEETVYVRSVGLDATEADSVVRAFTPEGGRPEPVRIARLAARAADEYRHEKGD